MAPGGGAVTAPGNSVATTQGDGAMTAPGNSVATTQGDGVSAVL